jgi:hypothetical protein
MRAAAYPLPETLEPELTRVRDYWRGLVRGANDMPFWDDFKPSAISGASFMLLDVFAQRPPRFRFGGVMSDDVGERYGRDIQGLFTDEIDARGPFELLTAQSVAAVECAGPTYYRHAGGSAPFSRLLLPMWGDGHVGMLLAAFAWR